ncbi:MAG TPA: hypothetical protein VGU45_08075 [Microvirga sp.]|nr:hypothetical protein [Microvirga sp.]
MSIRVRGAPVALLFETCILSFTPPRPANDTVWTEERTGDAPDPRRSAASAAPARRRLPFRPYLVESAPAAGTLRP